MMARKKIEIVEVPSHLSLEKRIKLAVADKRVVAIIEKDRRLIEAALATDQRVASLDDKVRKHLQDHRSKLPEVASICWVNPNTPAEGVVAWLESGHPLIGSACSVTFRPVPRNDASLTILPQK